MPRTRRWRCNVWRSPECQPIITHNGGREEEDSMEEIIVTPIEIQIIDLYLKRSPYMHFVRLGSSHKRLEISGWLPGSKQALGGKVYSLHRNPPCVCFGHLYFAVAARSLSSYLQILANCFLSRSETGKPENRHSYPHSKSCMFWNMVPSDKAQLLLSRGMMSIYDLYSTFANFTTTQ